MLTLGEFLNDPATKEEMRDGNIVRTLSFKAALHDAMFISKAEAIANSDHWDPIDESDDYDPPAADSASLFGFEEPAPSNQGGSNEVGRAAPPTPPATVSGRKRSARS